MKELFRPGDAFRRYTMSRRLGEGATGEVWLARDNADGALFAIKILDPAMAEAKPEFVSRFLREAKLASKIRHPNLVAVHDAGFDGAKGVYFLVMDYVEGDTLRTAIALGGPQNENEAAGTVLSIADVLAVAQRCGMVHRDLKPENVMIGRDGAPKLLDLGVAKTSAGFDSLATVAQTVLGTPAYIAPEQALDSSNVDARADVYSLGVMLFELLAGRRPYGGDTPAETLKALLDDTPSPDVREFRPDVSAKLAAIVAKMCAKDPAARYSSPAELAAALREAGYSAPEVSAAPGARTESPDMGELLSLGSGGGAQPATDTAIWDGDPEVSRFIERRRRRRRISLALKIAAAAIAAAAIAAALSLGASAATVRVSDCVRDPAKDVWAAADVAFAREVMDDVFAKASVEPSALPFGNDSLFDWTKTEVVLSAFDTPALAKNYDFPLQPLGRMHFALYATKERAAKLLKTRITDWPRMRVGYSPVSQGAAGDMESYFAHATLSPEYVEFQTSAEAVEALKEGKIEVLFLYTPSGRRPEGFVEVVPIGSRNVYFAVRKDRPALFESLRKAYRECYIENIAEYDALREKLLGEARPGKRVRVAAYLRGNLFEVEPSGARSGVIEEWLKAIASGRRWTLDYVYGTIAESVADVSSGRLDMIGGMGFSSYMEDRLLFPHTPIGMLRAYLWTSAGSRFKPGDRSTWKGMRVGLLAGSFSAERVKSRLESEGNPYGISYWEYATDAELNAAYFSGEVDACVNIEMPSLDKERALHVYVSHPMYVCVSPRRKDLLPELEKALDGICEDFPMYMRMITERHYGIRNEMSLLTFAEAEWLKARRRLPEPVVIDFSPWPVNLKDENGKIVHFAKEFLAELSRRTGLEFDTAPQTGILTAEARFSRGETDLWIPYPAHVDVAAMGGVHISTLPVPKMYAHMLGAEGGNDTLEIWAGSDVPAELAGVIRKAVSGIESEDLQEMFIKAAAERSAVRRIFGMTESEFEHLMLVSGVIVLSLVAAFALVMAMLLKRQVRRANKAAETAEEYSKAKTRFLAMMSHELRTPLNAVIGFAEFLFRPGCDAQRQREYINGIQLSATALLDLINDILDLSKLDSGAVRMRSGECSVARLAEELPAIFGYHVRTPGVKLRICSGGGIPVPVVKLSQHGMRQILINLVGNSAKFTDSGEIRVEFGWEEATRTLRIRVRDTGCGISGEKMAKLFDPFVQDIASRMKHAEGAKRGTGLGLPIVKRMVDAAGGSIDVKSEPGKGTEFDISIPGLEVLRDSPAAERVAPCTAPRSALVVDDLSVNRRILGIHLANLGVEDVRFAENGRDAMSKMQDWIPQAVLTDLWMPEMDGSQLAAAMRADPRLSSVPVFAITADIDASSTFDMSVFTKVIAKPITGDKLSGLFG